MNDEQINRFIDAFELFALGVDKIGDSCKSIASYLWLPVQLAFFALLCGGLILLFVRFV